MEKFIEVTLNVTKENRVINTYAVQYVSKATDGTTLIHFISPTPNYISIDETYETIRNLLV